MPRTSSLHLFWLSLLILLPLLAVAVGSVSLDVRPSRYTRDLAILAGVHPLTGFLSALGILLWGGSAAIWLLTAHVRASSPLPEGSTLALHSGLLSAYLCIDDLFMFHEHLAPLHLGAPEKLVYGLLALSVAAYLWRHRHALWKGADRVWLIAALACLSGSASIDVALGRWLWHIGDWSFLVEDGLKWAGICFWITFCIARCTFLLRQTGGDAGALTSGKAQVSP